MEQLEPFYDTAEVEGDKLELLSPINLGEFVQKSSTLFKFDINSKIKEDDAKILDNDINDDTDEMETIPSPWENKFADLKQLMQRIPVAKYPDKRELLCIFKRITDEGAPGGEPMGRRKCKVRFGYQMYFESEKLPFDTSFYKNSCIRTIRWDEMFSGIFLALATMRKGEKAEFIIDYRLMHLEDGIYLDRMVEPRKKADVLFVAEMIDFIEVGDANCEENDEPIDKLRNFGLMKSKIIGLKSNAMELFDKGRTEQAIRYNHRAIERLNFCEIYTAQEIDVHKRLLIECYTHLVDCYSKSEKWEKAIMMVTKLNEFPEMAENAEILVKKAIALSKVGDNYDESICVLRKAQQISPNNPLVASTLNKIIIERDKYKNETKNMWQRAFQCKGNAENQLVKEADAKFKKDFQQMIDTFDDLSLKKGIPLAGYTSHEMKLIDGMLATNANIELQRRKNFNGQDIFTIHKNA